MNAYLLESIAPLVFRTGKPFGSLATADDTVFPLPSSAAGMVRAICIEQRQGTLSDYQQKLEDAEYQKILRIQTIGPLLVRFSGADSQHYDILVAKPADALYFEDKTTKSTKLIRLSPKSFDSQTGADLPNNLLPVQMETAIKGKPAAGVAYWTLKDLLAWQAGENLSFDTVKKNGLTALPVEIRTHVAIENSSRAAAEGKLFQTASFDLNHPLTESAPTSASKSTANTWHKDRYGFLVLSQEQLQADMATFGGERRLSYFRPVQASAELKQPPKKLLERINQAGGFSITLLTPGVFSNGYLPGWLETDSKQGSLPGSHQKISLKACAINRWQPVSGWDSILWKPKATRKAVGAGSVYWFKLQDKLDLQTLQQLWFTAMADHPQDKNDGFGLITVAPWQAVAN